MKHPENTPLRERDVEALLTPSGRPEPPAGLLDRLRADLPDDADAPPVADAAAEPAPPAPAWWSVPRTHRLRLAAALVAALGAGLLVSRLLDAPPEAMRGATSDASVAGEAAGEPRALGYVGGTAPEEAEPVAEEAEPVAEDADAFVDAVAAAPQSAAEAPSTAVDEARRDETEAAGTITFRGGPTRIEADADERRERLRERLAEASVSRFESEVAASPAPERPPRARDVAAPAPVAPPPVFRREASALGYLGADEASAIPVAAPRAGTTGGDAEPNGAPYGDVFFEGHGTNPFVDTEDDALSTFGLDVDTASYTVARRYLRDGYLPPRDAVRLEEMVNYFDYGDPPPADDADFALHAEGAPSPFAHGEGYYLLRLAIRARDVADRARPPATLVFTVDVSGSMARENRLGLVRESLALLVDELRPDDRVGLVVYGTNGRVVLEPTADHGAIRHAIGRLTPEGSTNAAEGLELAYEMAARHRERGRIHRVILCSDGVANVGDTAAEAILARVRRHADEGIELTTVGFGMGNYNDVLMERLADDGNGRYAYVDDLGEAGRIFVESLTGTLLTVAAEARVQVELDPDLVSRWRLLGYENRDIADERFRDDSIDAGEIGAGHAVTALYEVKLVREPRRRDRLATLHLRWGSVAAGEMVEVARPVTGADLARDLESASRRLRLAAVVAELAEVLRGSYWARDADLGGLLALAQRVSAEYPGERDVVELAELVARTRDLVRQRDSR